MKQKLEIGHTYLAKSRYDDSYYIFKVLLNGSTGVCLVTLKDFDTNENRRYVIGHKEFISSREMSYIANWIIIIRDISDEYGEGYVEGLML